MTFKFRVSKKALPPTEHERYDILFEIFSHSYISCEAISDEWEICLFPPNDFDYYIDQKLVDKLNWWSLSASLELIPFLQKKTKYGRMMLHDTWTLVSWLEAFASTQFTDIVIFHVDAHSDLMSPKIGVNEEGFVHLTSKSSFQIFTPAEVSLGVQFGTIDQGCFVTPFVHTIKRTIIIHLVPKRSVFEAYHLIPTMQNDTVLWNGTPRLAIKTDPLKAQHISHDISLYYQVSNLLEASSLLKTYKYPILLHIDMDYFCNRYDGQSDWYKHWNFEEDSIEMILLKMDNLAKCILDPEIKSRILSTDVALVPGFFPSEYWEKSVSHIETILNQLT